jgi:hypothetical protein
MIWKVLLNFAKKEFFRLMIYFRDKIDHAFIAHLMLCIVPRPQDGAGLAREIFQIGQSWQHKVILFDIQQNSAALNSLFIS